MVHRGSGGKALRLPLLPLPQEPMRLIRTGSSLVTTQDHHD